MPVEPSVIPLHPSCGPVLMRNRRFSRCAMSTFAVAAVLIAITAAPISATVTGTTRRSMPTTRPTRARPAIAAPANVPPPAFVKADTTHAVSNGTFDLGTVALTATAGSPATRWRLDGDSMAGVVSMPSDEPGPFPLAIVLHGAHAFCDVAGR